MFKKVFNHENKFWRAMGKLADLVALNLLFLVCCLPVVTIGASASAFYSMLMKIAEETEPYILRGFFRAFKENFKKATIIWIIMFIIGAFLIFDIYLVTSAKDVFPTFFRYIIYAITFVYALMLSFVFALQAKFENTVGGTIKNSLLMGIGHFLPWGILIVIITYLPLLLFFIRLDFIFYTLPLLVLCGFGLIGYGNSKCFLKIFKRYMPEPEPEIESDPYEGFGIFPEVPDKSK